MAGPARSSPVLSGNEAEARGGGGGGGGGVRIPRQQKLRLERLKYSVWNDSDGVFEQHGAAVIVLAAARGGGGVAVLRLDVPLASESGLRLSSSDTEILRVK